MAPHGLRAGRPSWNCGAAPAISSHGAFEPTKMWPAIRSPGSSSSTPAGTQYASAPGVAARPPGRPPVRPRAGELLRHRRSAGAAEGGAPAARLGVELAELLAGRPAQVGRRYDDHRVRRDTRHLAALRAVTHPDLRHGAVVLETDRPAEAGSAGHGRRRPPR